QQAEDHQERVDGEQDAVALADAKSLACHARNLPRKRHHRLPAGEEIRAEVEAEDEEERRGPACTAQARSQSIEQRERRQALQREGKVPEISRQRHLEEPRLLEERDGVEPSAGAA